MLIGILETVVVGYVAAYIILKMVLWALEAHTARQTEREKKIRSHWTFRDWQIDSIMKVRNVDRSTAEAIAAEETRAEMAIRKARGLPVSQAPQNMQQS